MWAQNKQIRSKLPLLRNDKMERVGPWNINHCGDYFICLVGDLVAYSKSLRRELKEIKKNGIKKGRAK